MDSILAALILAFTAIAEKLDAWVKAHSNEKGDLNELTPENYTEFKALNDEYEAAKSKRDERQSQVDLAGKAAVALRLAKAPDTSKALATNLGTDGDTGGLDFTTLSVPRGIRRYGKITSFKGTDREREAQAYAFGTWCLAAMGFAKSTERCNEMGLKLEWAGSPRMQLAQTESTNAGGGFYVPDEFDAAMIDLREVYGVARQIAKVTPMASDTKRVNRRVSGMTAYWKAELQAATASGKATDQVQLVAKKLTAKGQYSNELSEDAVIDIGNDLAQEIGYAFAVAEDQALINGNATDTYGNIMGFCPAFLALNATIANIAGLVVGAGNAYSELLLTDFQAVMAKLPVYAYQRGARWLCSNSFWALVMQKLALAAGGNSQTDVVNGVPQNRFLGYPVQLCQVMPATEGNSQICAMFGAFDLAATIGDRKQTTIRFSDVAYDALDTDSVYIYGRERLDMNVHDIGNASSSSSARVAGPVVGLITAAS